MSDPTQAGFHLAQINVARARAPLTDPRLADFVAQLDQINALADRGPGFVWRLQTDAGNATDIEVSDDPQLIVNMSVWERLEHLARHGPSERAFTFKARFPAPSGAAARITAIS